MRPKFQKRSALKLVSRIDPVAAGYRDIYLIIDTIKKAVSFLPTAFQVIIFYRTSDDLKTMGWRPCVKGATEPLP
jgi:hypothetical protein